MEVKICWQQSGFPTIKIKLSFQENNIIQLAINMEMSTKNVKREKKIQDKPAKISLHMGGNQRRLGLSDNLRDILYSKFDHDNILFY